MYSSWNPLSGIVSSAWNSNASEANLSWNGARLAAEKKKNPWTEDAGQIGYQRQLTADRNHVGGPSTGLNQSRRPPTESICRQKIAVRLGRGGNHDTVVAKNTLSHAAVAAALGVGVAHGCCVSTWYSKRSFDMFKSIGVGTFKYPTGTALSVCMLVLPLL